MNAENAPSENPRRAFLLAALAGTGATLLSEQWAQSVLKQPASTTTLSISEKSLWRALLPVVLQAYWPSNEADAARLSADLIGRIETAIALQSPRIQAELQELFTVLDNFLGTLLLGGNALSWSQASVIEIEQFLQRLRNHALALMQTAYAGIHNLIMAAYWSDEAHWSKAGYAPPAPVR